MASRTPEVMALIAMVAREIGATRVVAGNDRGARAGDERPRRAMGKAWRETKDAWWDYRAKGRVTKKTKAKGPGGGKKAAMRHERKR